MRDHQGQLYNSIYQTDITCTFDETVLQINVIKLVS